MPQAFNNGSSLVEILQQRIVEQPDKTAYIFLQDGESASGQMTYRELDREARKIALYCQSIIAVGERALLLYPPGLEFVAAFFGCLYAGIVAIPVYPPKRNQKLSRLLTIIDDSQATVVLTTAAVKQDWQQRWQSEPMLNKLHWIATDELDINPQTWSPEPSLPGQLAMLQYTSGSIGKPKGVMVSHRNLMHNLRMIHACFGHNQDTVGVNWLPHYHDMGLIGGVLQSVYGGFVVMIMPPVTFVRKPIRWLQAISRYQVTASGGPNFAYDLCVSKIKPEQLADLDLSSWKLAFTGAEPIRAETLDKFIDTFASCGFQPEALNPGYGLAESTLFVSGWLPKSAPAIKWIDAGALTENRVVDAVAESPESRGMVNCGRSWSEQEIAIADPQTCKLLEERQVGEIWVKGDSVALGYWNQPQQTKEVFKACLADGSGSFLRTGDLGFLLDGDLFVTGRLKDVIIIRGRNHYPQDIELTVQKSHPALRLDCGAAFVTDIEGEARLTLVQEVERSYIRNLDVAEIARQINQAVSTEHELSVYAVILIKTGSIPKTSSGKIKRRACRDGYLNGELKVIGEWQLQLNDTLDSAIALETQNNQTSDGINNWLKQWLACTVSMDVKLIDDDAAFSNYGVDSVMAMELIQDLEDWLQCPLDPNIIWNFPRLNALGTYLANQNVSETNNSAPQQADLAAEAVLDRSIGSTSNAKPDLTKPTAIFLTGVTGFLGAFLLTELLQQTQAHIYCLVRATDIESGKARIQQNLASYHLWQQHFTHRITTIIGDLSQPQLGLSKEQWQALAEQIDVIYHNGALLNYVYPYELLKPTNVIGTESILKLASQGHTKSVHYISSTAVFDCHTAIKPSMVEESDFIERPKRMYLGYSQSKWVADKMMQIARARGLNVCIYRPGLIGGHSQTGVANASDVIWRIINGSIQMGYMPEIDLELDLIPVDYVSKNIVALSRQDISNVNDSTFHLNHPRPLPWNQLIKFTQDAGYQVQPLALEQWLEKLKTIVRPNPANPLYPLIPFLLSRPTENLTILELMQSRKSPQVSCQKTLKTLAQTDKTIACSALDENLWQTYFDYFKDNIPKSSKPVIPADQIRQ